MDKVKVAGNEIQALPEGTSPDVDYYGRLTWFTLRATKVPHQELDDEFGRLGIDPSLKPSKMGLKPAFKSAAKMQENKVKTAEGDHVEIFMVRQVGPDVRKLIRETQNVAGKKLTYHEVGEWEFDENAVTSSGFVISDFRVPMTDPDRENLKELWEQKDAQMRRDMADNLVNYRENSIRQALTDALGRYRAVSVRRTGGVYFVPETQANELQKWSDLFGFLNQHNTGYGRSGVTAVEVIKNTKNQTMLQQNIDEDAETQLTDLLNNAGVIFKEKKTITPKTYGSLAKKMSTIRDSLDESEKMLKVKMITSNVKMEQLEALMSVMHKLVK